MKTISKNELKKYMGKYIYAVQQDGTKVKGKLVAVDNERAFIKPLSKDRSKKVGTNFLCGLFILGIIAFGLLAIGICSCCGRRECCCRRRHCECSRRRCHHGRRKHHRKHRCRRISCA